MSNTEPTQLKPCPWCKGTGLHLENTDTRWFVECHNLLCLADGPARPTEAEAIAAWNQRAHSAPAKGNAEMVAALVAVRAQNAADMKRTGAVWEAYDGAVLDCIAALTTTQDGSRDDG